MAEVTPLDRFVRAAAGFLEIVAACLPEQLLRTCVDRDFDRAIRRADNALDDPDDGGEAMEPMHDPLRWKP